MTRNRTLMLLIALLALLALAACTGETGAGNVTTAAADVGAFNAIAVDGIGDVVVEEGGEPALQITADENFLDGDNITAAVEGDTLRIATANIVNPEELVFHVTVDDLDRLQTAGLMDVQLVLDQNDEDGLAVEMEGGSVTASGRVRALEVATDGTAEFDGTELDAEAVSVNAAGVSSVLVTVESGPLAVTTADTATVRYTGEPQLSADTSAGGTVEAD